MLSKSNENKSKKLLKDCIFIIIGSSIISFGIYNIHYQCGIAEGGELGIELLFKNFFNVSPAITSFMFDLIFFTIGVFLFGNKFAVKALVGTLAYSIFYFLWELFPPIIPSLSSYKLIACLLGAIFVGFGSGLAVTFGGSCGGDDSLALIMSKITKLPVSICYFIFDFIIIVISLSYLELNSIIYSFITAGLSSFIIEKVQRVIISKNLCI